MDNELKLINKLGKSLDYNNYWSGFTMHELSKLLKIPYASFYRTIQKISDLLVFEQIGKSKLLLFDFMNPVLKSYLAISSYQETKEYLTDQPLIRMIVKDTEINHSDILILFGSYAQHKHSEKSDIDLMIINKDGKKSLSFSKLELLSKKKINPIFVTKKEFQLMLKDKEENVGKQLLKNHILLSGYEKFWEVVFNAICKRKI